MNPDVAEVINKINESRNERDFRDIASYVARTEQLDNRGRLAVALELIQDSGISVRPEVTAYLREALAESK